MDLFLHLDQHLNEWAGVLGPWLYLVLFAIVFCETGLVVTPFLPGDSLLFAVGALAATEGSPINVALVWMLLLVAGVLGDAVNYSIGYRLGPRVFSKTDSKIFNREHLLRTQHFYEKYGGKTIFLARFVPIIRTFAPFVAGVGRMSYPRFAMFNITGALHLGDAVPVRRLLVRQSAGGGEQLLAGDPRHHRAVAAADRDRVPQGARRAPPRAGAAGGLTRLPSTNHSASFSFSTKRRFQPSGVFTQVSSWVTLLSTLRSLPLTSCIRE